MGKVKNTKTKRAQPQPVGLLANIGQNLLQPTTIAGLLAIGASLATGGLASWLNAETLPALITGVGLIFAKDERSIATMFTPAAAPKAESEAP